MEKTIEEWYQDLPQYVREKAIKNARTQNMTPTLGLTVEDLQSALICGFSWGNSPEEHDYWQDQHNKLFGD